MAPAGRRGGGTGAGARGPGAARDSGCAPSHAGAAATAVRGHAGSVGSTGAQRQRSDGADDDGSRAGSCCDGQEDGIDGDGRRGRLRPRRVRPDQPGDLRLRQPADTAAAAGGGDARAAPAGQGFGRPAAAARARGRRPTRASKRGSARRYWCACGHCDLPPACYPGVGGTWWFRHWRTDPAAWPRGACASKPRGPSGGDPAVWPRGVRASKHRGFLLTATRGSDPACARGTSLVCFGAGRPKGPVSRGQWSAREAAAAAAAAAHTAVSGGQQLGRAAAASSGAPTSTDPTSASDGEGVRAGEQSAGRRVARAPAAEGAGHRAETRRPAAGLEHPTCGAGSAEPSSARAVRRALGQRTGLSALSTSLLAGAGRRGGATVDQDAGRAG